MTLDFRQHYDLAGVFSFFFLIERKERKKERKKEKERKERQKKHREGPMLSAKHNSDKIIKVPACVRPSVHHFLVKNDFFEQRKAKKTKEIQRNCIFCCFASHFFEAGGRHRKVKKTKENLKKTEE